MSDGLRIVGWGPFRMPGEKKRRLEAEEYAEKMMGAVRGLRDRDAAVNDVPPSGIVFLPGDTVNITREDGTTQRYKVTEGDDPGTVWVDPYGTRQLEMRRIENDDDA